MEEWAQGSRAMQMNKPAGRVAARAEWQLAVEVDFSRGKPRPYKEGRLAVARNGGEALACVTKTKRRRHKTQVGCGLGAQQAAPLQNGSLLPHSKGRKPDSVDEKRAVSRRARCTP
jgi:hypothetical protein